MTNKIDLGDLQRKLELAAAKARRCGDAMHRAKAALWRAEAKAKDSMGAYHTARVALDDATHALLK